jgi:sugar phosphate isomerase/epimerase
MRDNRKFSLDHITVVDATPVRLVELARAAGCDAVCLFLASMDVLPRMPRYDLARDRAQRRALRTAMAAHGVGLDLVYPFTLTGRSDPASFVPLLECAAELGAGLVNVLLYDRDPVRRLDRFGGFCDLARGFALNVAVEFYPPSQVPSLAAARDLVGAIGRVDVGINADLLHLMRSGGTIAELGEGVLYGQVADGPASAPPDPEHEASTHRLLAGEGAFDIAGFVAALDCPISVEIPRVEDDCDLDRATRALDSVRRCAAGPGPRPTAPDRRPSGCR